MSFIFDEIVLRKSKDGDISIKFSDDLVADHLCRDEALWCLAESFMGGEKPRYAKTQEERRAWALKFGHKEAFSVADRCLMDRSPFPIPDEVE